MKNIFLLDTDKPSYLFIIDKSKMFVPEAPYLSYSTVGGRVHKTEGSDIYRPQFIYITNDEPIKINEPYLGEDGNIYYLCEGGVNFNGKKIVLTNDTSLIEDGVQEVNSSFLSFYAENTPEYVEVDDYIEQIGWESDANGRDMILNKRFYFLIFPQKEQIKTEEYSDIQKKVLEDNKEFVKRTDNTKLDILMSEFENLEGITSNMFDEKDWSRFNRFVENREKEETEKDIIMELQKDPLLKEFDDKVNENLSALKNKKETGENIIDNWLEKNGNPEIMKQVEREAEESELEEVAERISKSHSVYETSQDDVYQGFVLGAKWQKSRMYSEEEVIALIHKFNYDLVNSNIETFKEWFDEHKKQTK